MPTFTARITDSKGQTASATLSIPVGSPPGGTPPPPPPPGDPPGPVPATTEICGSRAPIGSQTYSQSWGVLLTAVGSPPLTMFHAYSGPNIPSSVNTGMQAAIDKGSRIYLNVKSDQITGGFWSTTYNPAAVETPIKNLVALMKSRGLKGWITLDHEPQNSNHGQAWEGSANHGTGSPARLAAARWRAAQRVASRAVWEADPSESIGYSVCLQSAWQTFQWLPRQYWDPAVRHSDDMSNTLYPAWDAAEKAKVLFTLDVYCTIHADGTFETIDAKKKNGDTINDWEYWETVAGYPRMGIGEIAYNTGMRNDSGSWPSESRVAELISGRVGAVAGGDLITGSLGEWVYRKSVAGKLRHFAWYDTLIDKPAVGDRGSLMLEGVGQSRINAFHLLCQNVGVQVP
jgi:hypothetical protein